jgi:hypothetical protein
MKTLVVLPDGGFKANSRRQEAVNFAINSRNSGKFNNVRLFLEGVVRNDDEAGRLSEELKFPVEGTDGKKIRVFADWFALFSIYTKLNILNTSYFRAKYYGDQKSLEFLRNSCGGEVDVQERARNTDGMGRVIAALMDELAFAEKTLMGRNSLTESHRLSLRASNATWYENLSPLLSEHWKMFFAHSLSDGFIKTMSDAAGEYLGKFSGLKSSDFFSLISPLADARNVDIYAAYTGLDEARRHMAQMLEINMALNITEMDFDMGILHTDAAHTAGRLMLDMLLVSETPKVPKIGQLFIKNAGEKSFEYKLLE